MGEKRRDTIDDFGRQWTAFKENNGYYASLDVLDELFGPLLDKGDIEGKSIADVGAGAGRFVRMFAQLGASRILALEPSEAVDVLRENLAGIEGVEIIQATADKLPARGFDYVFCIGVLQFIPQPEPALRAMGRALGPNGRLFLWVYGREQTGIYLLLLRPLRIISTRLPHPVLSAICGLLVIPARIYGLMCHLFDLPFSKYMREYFLKLDRYGQKLTIYDQLNPKSVRYYKKAEIVQLLEKCGFKDIRIHNRLGYSWSVIARYGGPS